MALADRWNGIAWAMQAMPNPPGGATSGVATSLADVSCTSAIVCTAVGNSALGSLVERWNGTSWAIQPTPSLVEAQGTDSLGGVSCTSAAACTAVGQFANYRGTSVTLAERWNGASWAIQPIPTPRGGGDLLIYDVSCTSATFCTAVGTYNDYLDALVEQFTAGPSPTVASAKLTGIPAACVLAPFVARVTGSEISTVTWYLDGERVSGRALRRGTRYAASISAPPGKHELTVRVKFNASSNARARTLRRAVSGCPRVEPKFTG